MRTSIGWRSLAITVAILAGVGAAVAEVRNWVDATGKFKVDAELVSVKDGKVLLRTNEGKEITVAMDRLSDADRAFVMKHLATQSPTKASPPTKANPANKAIREIAKRFYDDLRTKVRDQARSVLTDAGQTLVKEDRSSLPGLPTPDESAQAVKVGSAKVAGTQAEIPVQVRVGGNAQKTTLHLRNEADQWRVFAISAKLGDDEKTIDFEAPTAQDSKTEPQDPLLALVGNPMELEGFTVDGKRLEMAEFKGKVVLIDFWATWCGPCREEIPNILANWQKHHDAGFEVIAISVDQDLDELKKFVAAEKPPWTVVADQHPNNKASMARKYGITGIPAFVLIGKDGNVAAVHCRGQRLGQQLAQLLDK